MQVLIHILLVILQLALLLTLSPFVVGLIRKVKARLQCRRGASLFQPYADLAKLFRKQPVISSTTSWIFTAAPYIVFASTVAAGLLIPVFISHTPLNFAGNIIALVYVLALGTFFLILAGLDAGSAFGGMGSSREAIVATLAEPAMMLSILSIALTAGSTNLSTIVHQSALMQGVLAPPAHLMALAALFIVTLAETGRVPVDNPATHLELTMIHEAMLLEYSGRYLALMEWAAGIKLVVFLTLIVNVFAPWGIATSPAPSAIAVGLLVYLAKVSALAVVMAGLCVVLGLAPMLVVPLLDRVTAPLTGAAISSQVLALDGWVVAPVTVEFSSISTPVLAMLLVGAGALGLLIARLCGTGLRVRYYKTWGCGLNLTPRMEYSATAFAQPIKQVFETIYQPAVKLEREFLEQSKYFIKHQRFESHIHPVFELYLYQPVVRRLLSLAGRLRVIQAGSLHVYLAYIFLTLVLLLLWAG